MMTARQRRASSRKRPKPTTAGISKRGGDDRRVAGATAGLGGEAEHLLGIQPGGFAGREVMRQRHARHAVARERPPGWGVGRERRDRLRVDLDAAIVRGFVARCRGRRRSGPPSGCRQGVRAARRSRRERPRGRVRRRSCAVRRGVRASRRRTGSAIMRACAPRMSAYWGPSRPRASASTDLGFDSSGLERGVESIEFGGNRFVGDCRAAAEASRGGR